MAIEDALRIIDQDWDEIESRLTVSELMLLADRGSEFAHGRASVNLELLFGVVSAALDDKHAAWGALRESNTRYATDPDVLPPDLVALRIRNHAEAALTRPTIVAEAQADTIVDTVRRTVLRYGYVASDERFPGALSVTVNDQHVYPTFQFDLNDRQLLRPIVGAVNDQFGGDSDSLAALSWWLSPNAWLETFPAALVGTAREAEVLTAFEQLDSDSW
jgi:hypothetical protein